MSGSDNTSDLLRELSLAEENDKAIQREIDSVREDVGVQVEQAATLLTMFKKLLQRVDVISKRHEDTMAENIKLRAMLRAKDGELEKAMARIAELEAQLVVAKGGPVDLG